MNNLGPPQLDIFHKTNVDGHTNGYFVFSQLFWWISYICLAHSHLPRSQPFGLITSSWLSKSQSSLAAQQKVSWPGHPDWFLSSQMWLPISMCCCENISKENVQTQAEKFLKKIPHTGDKASLDRCG